MLPFLESVGLTKAFTRALSALFAKATNPIMVVIAMGRSSYVAGRWITHFCVRHSIASAHYLQSWSGSRTQFYLWRNDV